MPFFHSIFKHESFSFKIRSIEQQI